MCRAKDLIEQLLTTDPTRRPTAAAALQHPWLQVPPSRTSVSLAGALDNMKNLPRRLRSLSLERGLPSDVLPDALQPRRASTAAPL